MNRNVIMILNIYDKNLLIDFLKKLLYNIYIERKESDNYDK